MTVLRRRFVTRSKRVQQRNAKYSYDLVLCPFLFAAVKVFWAESGSSGGGGFGSSGGGGFGSSGGDGGNRFGGGMGRGRGITKKGGGQLVCSSNRT